MLIATIINWIKHIRHNLLALLLILFILIFTGCQTSNNNAEVYSEDVNGFSIDFPFIIRLGWFNTVSASVPSDSSFTYKSNDNKTFMMLGKPTPQKVVNNKIKNDIRNTLKVNNIHNNMYNQNIDNRTLKINSENSNAKINSENKNSNNKIKK
jgi:outer membrane lipopolysaccharide assembly protein LptE/RlpB